jgi:hypothetical protein
VLPEAAGLKYLPSRLALEPPGPSSAIATALQQVGAAARSETADFVFVVLLFCQT